MGLREDIRQLGTASAQLIRHPGALWRELVFLVQSNPENYYEFLGDDVLEAQDQGFENSDKPLWLNLGYWEEARTYPDACAAMARLVAEAAHFGPGDRVLDAGFGFGEQDLLWVREYDVASIIGINVTQLHVDVARKRAEQHGYAHRIDLRLGSATELPLGDASVNRVVALESAFHFDTRERFFEEAFRVLEPGGRIATADCVPYPGDNPGGLIAWLGWRRWGVPPANIYDRDVYRDRLLAQGFQNVEIRSIRHHVFPGMHKYAEQRNAGVPMDQIQVEVSEAEVEQCLGVDVWARQGGLTDYVIASAQKP